MTSFQPRRRQLVGALLAAPALAVQGGRSAGAAAPSDTPSLVAAVKPSIVAIGVHAPLQNPRFRFLGSGFAVGDGAQVVTCAHVVPSIDPEKRETIAIAVPTAEGARIHPARPLATDRDTDLATLGFDGAPLPPLEVARAEEVREGAQVLVIGFPIGSALGLFAATHRGMIAAVTPSFIPAASSAALRAQNLQVMRGRAIQLLQLDATAYPGNSGGPVVDAATGRVVGVISFVLAKGSREGALQHPTGISYAIPSRYLEALLGRR